MDLNQKLDALATRESDSTEDAPLRDASFRDAILGSGRSVPGIVALKCGSGPAGERNPGEEVMHGDYHANSHQDNSAGGGHGDSHVDEHNDSN